MCAANAFNLNGHCSRSISHKRYSLAIVFTLVKFSRFTTWSICWHGHSIIVKCLNAIAVSGSVQTNQQTNKHTHMCNAVTLVWGSLRLASLSIINSRTSLLLAFLTKYTQYSEKELWQHSSEAQVCNATSTENIPKLPEIQTPSYSKLAVGVPVLSALERFHCIAWHHKCTAIHQ